MRSRATAERAAPRLGVFASVLLHVALVATVFVSFSKKLDIAADNTPVVHQATIAAGNKDNWYLSAHRAISVSGELIGQRR